MDSALAAIQKGDAKSRLKKTTTQEKNALPTKEGKVSEPSLEII